MPRLYYIMRFDNSRYDFLGGGWLLVVKNKKSSLNADFAK
jgi:hypothetical protein